MYKVLRKDWNLKKRIANFLLYRVYAVERFLYRQVHGKDHEGRVLRLSGPKGAEFGDFEVTGVPPYEKYPKLEAEHNVHLFVKVVGLKDDKAPERDWGATWEKCY